ncbi:folate-binding protein YgfZ [Marinomonas sp. A79]|uniref:Folate-binding protein YgfZ n=1 Tax=Marinomonas vulgaris TaxID=2823372 RepID=A0ABS5HCQ4_9GAMM|nr:folate-binding protein YgfZ [Marinomonas vulgaris]MBR7889430.1 folate-binding protein YgfZ [Marinomonas vulgaris]
MNTLQHIIDAIGQHKDVLAKHVDLGVIKITGADTKKFLQGQVTCDMNKLSDDNGLYGAVCSVKGRIIANFFVLQGDDSVFLLMTKDLVEKTLIHLKKYAVFFKTQLSDASEDFHIYSYLTPQAPFDSTSYADKISELLPMSHQEGMINLTVCNTPFKMEWRLVEAAYPALTEQNAELTSLSLLTARPLITLEQSETILPQWLNMQSTGGISFTKGCYTGQEIVARMQYRGKSKKQLALITWEGELDVSKDLVDEEGKSLGQILACGTVQDTNIAQVIVSTDPSEIIQPSLDGKTVYFLPLSYPLAIK